MLRALWFCELDVFQEFISSTKRPYAKELETVDFKDKLEETKGQINSSVKELTDGKYPLMFCQQLSKEVSLLRNACFKPKVLNIWKLLRVILAHKLSSLPVKQCQQLQFLGISCISS